MDTLQGGIVNARTQILSDGRRRPGGQEANEVPQKGCTRLLRFSCCAWEEEHRLTQMGG